VARNTQSAWESNLMLLLLQVLVCFWQAQLMPSLTMILLAPSISCFQLLPELLHSTLLQHQPTGHS
jgi:hypothetical protein